MNKGKLYTNAVSLTDMDRKRALSEVGFDDKEEKKEAFQCVTGVIIKDVYLGPGNQYPDLYAFKIGTLVYAISGLPFFSRLFIFKVWGIETKKKVKGRDVFSAKRVSWEPIKMTTSAVKIVLAELLEKSGDTFLKHFLSEGDWHQDPLYQHGTREFREKEYVFKTLDLQKRIVKVNANNSKPLRSDTWRLIAVHEDFSFLCHGTGSHPPIYPLKLVLKMKHREISEMIEKLKTNPLEYSFDKKVK
jgi:hypothetical protein